jgi:hypothetical protein
MALTRTQKRWAIGGSIGAATLFLGYELFRHVGREERSDSFSMQSHGKHEHRHHRRHRQGDNERGEYGSHNGHKRGEYGTHPHKRHRRG